MAELNFYNDNDPYVCQWVRNLIGAGLIPPGDVDERSIEDVLPEDLVGSEQAHLFAGICGWPEAFRLAGWPADRPVWSVSCPCPPFSVAGKQKKCPSCQSTDLVWCPRRTGYAICSNCENAWLADARHLWPEAWRLIAHLRPGTIFGEQVASVDGIWWLAAVQASLEILGYAFVGMDLPAASVGAPHIRQRLFWVAYSERAERGKINRPRRTEGRDVVSPGEKGAVRTGASGQDGGDSEAERVQRGREHGQRQKDSRVSERLDYTTSARRSGQPKPTENLETRYQARLQESERRGGADGMGQSANFGWQEGHLDPGGSFEGGTKERSEQRPWSDCILVPCTDGKWRIVPAEPAFSPLAPGVPGRVGRLRGYGNSIVPQVAAKFIELFMDENSC